MKTKLKISGIFVVFIAMLLLMGAVSASDESISNHTISEVETTELNADDSVLSLESADDNIIKEKESTQDSTITQTNDNTLGNSTGENTTTEGVITASDLKTEYHSGKTIKVTVTDKTTGKGIATTLKVQYVQNGKIAKVKLEKSSGFKSLDDEAVMALWNLEYWKGGRMEKDAEYIVPVRFDANLEE